MTAQLSVTLAKDTLTPLLARLKASAPKALDAAIRKEAEQIMTASRRSFVPVDTGNLKASGRVELAQAFGSPYARLVYGAPYAWVVHENPRSGRTGGTSPSGQRYRHWAQRGQWKYLEAPFLAATKDLDSRIADFLRARWLNQGTAGVEFDTGGAD